MVNALVVVTGLLLGAFQDVDNPEYKNWAKFKPGASAKMRMEMETGGMKMVTETTTTLKSLDAAKAVLGMASVTEVGGNKMEVPVPDREVPAKVKKGPEPDGKTPKPETGTEEIEAAGKKWKCTWTKMVTDIGGTKTTTTTWMCDEVPGQMVKMVTEGATKMTSVLVEVK